MFVYMYYYFVMCFVIVSFGVCLGLFEFRLELWLIRLWVCWVVNCLLACLASLVLGLFDVLLVAVFCGLLVWFLVVVWILSL